MERRSIMIWSFLLQIVLLFCGSVHAHGESQILLTKEQVQVTCMDDQVEVVFSRSDLSNDTETEPKFHFLNPKCSSQSNSTHVIAYGLYEFCGSLKTIYQSGTRYENILSVKLNADEEKNTEKQCKAIDIHVTCWKSRRRFRRSLSNQITYPVKIIKCEHKVGVGEFVEHGILHHSLLTGSSKVLVNKAKSITCPLLIGIGETLKPDRVLTFTQVVSPRKIITRKKAVTCREIENVGKFRVKMAIYSDQTYTSLLKVDQKNRKSASFQDIFYEISMNNSNLVIKPTSCYATPVPDPNSKMRYAFLKDGCSRDATLKFYPTTEQAKSRFSITGFRFMSSNSFMFYVHCDVSFCDQQKKDLCELSKCAKEEENDSFKKFSNRRKRSVENVIVRNIFNIAVSRNNRITQAISFKYGAPTILLLLNVNQLSVVTRIKTPLEIWRDIGKVPVTVRTIKRADSIFFRVKVYDRKTIKGNFSQYFAANTQNCFIGKSRILSQQMPLVKDTYINKEFSGVTMEDTPISEILRIDLNSPSFQELRNQQLFLVCDIAICSKTRGHPSSCHNRDSDSHRRKRRQISDQSDSKYKLECTTNGMTLYMRKPLVYDVPARSLQLIDPRCKATENATHVIVRTKTNGCGTRLIANGFYTEYANVVLEQPPNLPIIRRNLLEIPFRCSYSVAQVSTRIAVRYKAPTIEFRSRAFGTYKVDIEMYKGKKFTRKIGNEENAAEIMEDSRMYFQVKIASPQLNLAIFLDKCFGYPNRRIIEREEYAFIEKGCSLDDTLKFHNTSGDPGKIRFSIKPFIFDENTSNIIINCFVTACNASDKTSKCFQGCRDGSR